MPNARAVSVTSVLEMAIASIRSARRDNLTVEHLLAGNHAVRCELTTPDGERFLVTVTWLHGTEAAP